MPFIFNQYTVKKGISFRRLEGTRNWEKIMEIGVV
jgi:hypothetical protein